MAFLVDTNILIQSKNFHYPMPYFPGFWEWLDVEVKSGRIILLDAVSNEVLEGNDQLAEWMRQRSEYVVKAKTAAVLRQVASVTEYVMTAFPPKKIGTFLSGADAYLIAYAMGAVEAKHTVVTHERFDIGAKSPKIPVVCDHFGVPWCPLMGMFEALKPRFDLRQ
jgi:hypothetical protein